VILSPALQAREKRGYQNQGSGNSKEVRAVYDYNGNIYRIWNRKYELIYVLT
jgi:hypothetical protein